MIFWDINSSKTYFIFFFWVYVESCSTLRGDWNDVFICLKWYLGEWEIGAQNAPIEIKK